MRFDAFSATDRPAATHPVAPAGADGLPTPPAPPAPLRIVDSITELTGADAGCIAVSGSHGGLSSARYALAARPWLSVFNDAGGGKDGAGIAALAWLQAHGLAACTVAHHSARIGDARSTRDHGVVSASNPAAAALGLRCGQRLRDLLRRLGAAEADAPGRPAP